MSRKYYDTSSLIQSGLNLIPQAISIFDEDLKLQIWNTRFIELLSLPDSLIYKGTSFKDIIIYMAKRGEYGAGNIETIVEEKVEQALTFVPHYFERQRPNGTIISVEGSPLSEGGWITVYTDITEQKRQETFLLENRDILSDKLLQHAAMLAEANRELKAANRALSELKHRHSRSEQRMRLINQSIPAHIAHITPDYEYTYSNNRFSDIIGINYPNIIGKKMHEVFGYKLFNKIKPSITEALNGITSVSEIEIEIDRDERRTIRSTFKPDFNNDGKISGVFILTLDISEEVQTMEALLLNKKVESSAQLISGLAHDFGNILTVISGNLTRIESHSVDIKTNPEIINNTKNAAQRAIRIIENLLSFSGKQNLTPSHTNITNLLSEISRIFSHSLSNDIKLNLAIPDEEVFAFVDEGALQDVMINLMINAKDALDGTGNITISVNKISDKKQSEGKVQIIVKDDGSGFNEETKKRAFEPFFTSKSKKGGTGLGLSMAHGFAIQSKGKIEIINNTSKGASIILTLPISGSPVDTAFDTAKDFPLPDNNIALVVDDEPDIRQNIRYVLNNFGYSVIECEDTSEALDIVKTIENLQLVVSDVMMPGSITGVDFCDQIRKDFPTLPILLVTGLPMDHNILYGVTDRFKVIQKPIDHNKIKFALVNLKSIPC